MNGTRISRKPSTKSRNIFLTHDFGAFSIKNTIGHLLSHTWKIHGLRTRQHDEIGKKERAIYYLNKKFTDYESRYLPVEKIASWHEPSKD